MPLPRQSTLNATNEEEEEVAEDANKHIWMTVCLDKYPFPGNRNDVLILFR